ncbi:hypothetical protein [Actinokineospora iranica]|uniref:Uncharacterized protein n=1 Tax=Actinokineospora iranica TaxID=1271860 RepID=A0A1G6TAP5_9PSEU|nr:hypothetical protein [Actinokineospora iranica]SDD25626.1 hypothetical protein SAMN05216174_10935 [Actinokineospora iranica]
MPIKEDAQRLRLLSDDLTSKAHAWLTRLSSWLDETNRMAAVILGYSAGHGAVTAVLGAARDRLDELDQALTQSARTLSDAADHHDRKNEGVTDAKSPPATPGAAEFGHARSTNYRKTFFDAHPHLKGQVVVHHAVERQAAQIYPDAGLTDEEIHSLENLRGVPKGEANNLVHLSRLRKAWNAFYDENIIATKQDLLDFATKMDDEHGTQFRPPVR